MCSVNMVRARDIKDSADKSTLSKEGSWSHDPYQLLEARHRNYEANVSQNYTHPVKPQRQKRVKKVQPSRALVLVFDSKSPGPTLSELGWMVSYWDVAKGAKCCTQLRDIDKGARFPQGYFDLVVGEILCEDYFQGSGKWLTEVVSKALDVV